MGHISDITGLVLMLCLPFVVWVLNQSWTRRRLRPLGAWVWSRLNPVEEPDAATLELWDALRRQRLQRDLERVRRLIADDSWMSATRQVGNRLAHEQLLAEIADLGPAPALQAAVGWGPSSGPAPASAPVPVAGPAPVVATSRLAGPAHPSSPYVEVLELGPGRSRWSGRRDR